MLSASISETLRHEALSPPEERLRHELQHALQTDERLRDVTVEVRDATAVLAGRVGSWHAKQIAQTIALRIAGVSRVVNDVEVR